MRTQSKLHKKCIALINKATTLHHHQQANHPVDYHKWAADNNFESMLLEDAKQWHEVACEQAAASSTSSLSRQPSLDGHLMCKEPIVCYLESGFHEAVIKWIIETDQVGSLQLCM